MRKIIIAALIAILAYSIHLTSRPQYSILQSFGANCSSCHLNAQGGGIRTNGGWVARKDLSLVPVGDVGIASIFDGLSTNSIADDIILFGLDSRLQWAKWPAKNDPNNPKPVGTTEYDFMVMQLTPYLALSPFSWLTIEGQYNIAYEIYTDKRYLGQNPFAASMYIKPGDDLPNLRVGYFQPTIGMKWDDHTILGHQFYGAKTSRTPVKPDDYAEMGAQIDYEGFSGISLSAGAFNSNNLAQFKVKQLVDGSFKEVNLVDSNTISFAGRIFYSPELGGGLTSYIGATGFLNDDYYITNIHLGIGMSDKFCVLAEFTDSEKKNSRRAISWLGEVTYQLSETILPFVRAERQYTKEKSEKNLYYVNQFVIGAHINLLPYVDLLPEYRIVNREHVDGYHSQFAFQVHLWY